MLLLLMLLLQQNLSTCTAVLRLKGWLLVTTPVVRFDPCIRRY
jgi:hypothetical protein